MDHLGFASNAAVNQYLRFAEDHGLDRSGALRAAGVDPDQLREMTGRITGEQFQALLLYLVEASDDPLLGLNSGDYVQPGSYNVLGYIVMSCGTLREAIERIAPFERLVGDMGTTTLETDESGRLLLRWHCLYPHPKVRPQMVDNVFASWVNYSRWLANREAASPREVLLERPTPEQKAVARYQQVFNCPVRFGQTMNALVLDARLLEIPLRQPDQFLRQTLEGHASEQMKSLRDRPDDLISEVRRIIQQHLKQGITRQDMVAEALGVTTRTLQRRLGDHGHSYQQLLDDIRLDSARNLLGNSTASVADIAHQLGFAETRSFHRWFKGATGMTPGDFRDRHIQ